MNATLKHVNGTEVAATPDMTVWYDRRNIAAYIVAVEEDELGVVIRLHNGELVPPSLLVVIPS